MWNSLVILSGFVLLIAAVGSSKAESNVVYNHDCIVGSPPVCNNSLADDTSCRGLYSDDIRAWQSNDCDYMIYDVKAEEPSNKFVVIHAGRCDVDTEYIGDWAYEATGYNLYGLRPCIGINTQTCTYNRSVCDAIHLSWTANNGVAGAIASFGLGFNPPALLEYAKEPNNSFLFIHSYDGMPDYPWAGACNETTPAYICLWSDEDDETFDQKFNGETGSGGIKDLLEEFSNSEYIPCAVEVIDARNSSLTPGQEVGTYFGEKTKLNRYADLPCSGMFPAVPTQGFLMELQDTIAQGLHVAIVKAQEGNGSSATLDAFAKAISISLGD